MDFSRAWISVNQGFCGQSLGRGASKKRTPFAAILMVNLDHRQH